MIYQGKFFDGVKPASTKVELAVVDSVLEIRSEGQILDQWPLAKVYRDPSQIVVTVLGCRGDDDVRLEVEDVGLLKELGITASPWTPGLLKQHRKDFIFWGAAVAALVLILTFASEKITNSIVENIKPATEEKWLASFSESPIHNQCALTAWQASIAEKLVKRIYPLMPGDENFNVQVQFIKNPEENAFALPGNAIWLLAGIFKKAETPEEIAGILAHEIEHVKKRHVIKNIVHSTMFVAALNFMAGDVSGFVLVDPKTAGNVLRLGYDRDMEREADAGAMDRLEKAGISTQGLISFFLRADHESSFKIPGFLSTHPMNEERVNYLRRYDNGETNPPIMTPEEWDELKKLAACGAKT